MADAMIPFDKVCDLLTGLKNISNTSLKQKRLRTLAANWKLVSPAGQPVDNYPIVRLLLPHLDNQRSSYGIREKVFAALYCKILGLDPQSEEAQKIVVYKKQKREPQVDADAFIAQLRNVLMPRMPSKLPAKTMTVFSRNSEPLLLKVTFY